MEPIADERGSAKKERRELLQGKKGIVESIHIGKGGGKLTFLRGEEQFQKEKTGIARVRSTKARMTSQGLSEEGVDV